MAALAGDLSKQILGHSDAAKAFRPWWDNLEDSIMYAFVVIGLILLPMTFLSGTPVACAVHPDSWAGNYTSPNLSYEGGEVTKYARLLRGYAKKYCTEMYVSPFLLYYPFIMMIIPMVLVCIERFFIGFYNSEERLEVLYSSLVKTSLGREDVANMEKENVKNSHEIQQTFRNSSGCHDSYLYRTLVELILSVFLAFFLCGFSDIKGIAGALFDCDVHGIPFTCIIPNSNFFVVVYFLSLALILGYITMTSYNLLWLVHPRVGKLESVLSGCPRRSSLSVDSLDCPRISPMLRHVPEIRLDMYYDRKAKDFRLLMNLLAEQSTGLAHSFRMLSVFDKHFQRLWRPRDVKVVVQRYTVPKFSFEDHTSPLESAQAQKTPVTPGGGEDKPPLSVWVLWNDASIASYIAKKVSRSPFEYTVEINPPTEAPVKSYLYHTVPDLGTDSDRDSALSSSSTTSDSKALMLATGGKKTSFLSSSISDEEFGLSLASMYKYSCRFDGLSDGVDYTISIATELDGKTITQMALVATKNTPSSPPGGGNCTSPKPKD